MSWWNPYRWFVPDKLKFVEDFENSVVIFFSAQMGFSKRQIERACKKIIGKEGQYLETQMRSLFPSPPNIQEKREQVLHMIGSGYSQELRIVGKGADVARKYERNKEYPLWIGIREMDDNIIYRRYQDFVLSNIQLFIGLTKQKIKEFPDHCPVCSSHINPISFNKSSSSSAVVEKVAVEDIDCEFGEAVQDVGMEFVKIDGDGCCDRCGTTVVEWDFDFLKKMLKKMIKYQQKHNIRVFRDSTHYC